MDLGLSFTFVFQDEEWVKKLLFGAVASLVVFIGWIPLLGWVIEIARRVIRQDPEPLPDWTDLGGLFTLGLKGLVIFIVAALLPGILAIPYAILGAIADPQLQPMLPIVGSEEQLSAACHKVPRTARACAGDDIDHQMSPLRAAIARPQLEAVHTVIGGEI